LSVQPSPCSTATPSGRTTRPEAVCRACLAAPQPPLWPTPLARPLPSRPAVRPLLSWLARGQAQPGEPQDLALQSPSPESPFHGAEDLAPGSPPGFPQLSTRLPTGSSSRFLTDLPIALPVGLPSGPPSEFPTGLLTGPAPETGRETGPSARSRRHQVASNASRSNPSTARTSRNGITRNCRRSGSAPAVPPSAPAHPPGGLGPWTKQPNRKERFLRG